MDTTKAADMSSSSSDDEQGNHGNGNLEIHNNTSCGYEKSKLVANGREVFVLSRSCDCGKFTPYIPTSGKEDLQPKDGKDLHLSQRCRWKKTKTDDGCTLKRRCVCDGSVTAGFVGNVTSTAAN